MYRQIMAKIITILLAATVTTNIEALEINKVEYINNNICEKKKINIEDKLRKSYINNLIQEENETTTEKIIVEEEKQEELAVVNIIEKVQPDLSYNDIVYERAENYLTYRKGVVYFNDHKETYYTEEALPGPGLKIPGRHVAYDGTIRDENSYIVVASDLSFYPRGSIVSTSLGLGKVYDTGCSYGTIDIYVNAGVFSSYTSTI